MKANCDRCGNPSTKTKRITSKKTGKEYEMFECVHGCTNGKWAYSFFPPKNGEQKKDTGEALQVLKDIRQLLKQLVEKSNRVPLTSDELETTTQHRFKCSDCAGKCNYRQAENVEIIYCPNWVDREPRRSNPKPSKIRK